jgi:predicted MarR family transcription regulator
MALCQALTSFTHLPRGFRNRELRPHVEALLGRSYSTAQMTYDLRRLRLKGLLHRIPNTHRYTATSYGLKVAFFYAKLYLRILRPNWAALLPEDDRLPRPLRGALEQLDREIQKLYEKAALAA